MRQQKSCLDKIVLVSGQIFGHHIEFSCLKVCMLKHVYEAGIEINCRDFSFWAYFCAKPLCY